MMKVLVASALSAAVLCVAGCSGMSRQDRDTVVGAGVGAVGGSALTGGSTAGTLGGAAVGGYLGHEYSKKR